MNRVKNYIQSNKVTLAATLLYILVCLIALKWYRHAINPDGTSYITIAQKYAEGNFKDAVNGYWSPLLSWLLVPFVLVKKDPQVAAKLLYVLCGVTTLIYTSQLLKKWNIRQNIRTGFTLGLIPVLAFWTIASSITPDIFIVVLYILYLGLQENKPSYKNAVVVGVVGAVGYFAKAYFLPFFVLHCVFLVFYRIKIQQSSKVEVRYWLVSMATLLIFILPWIGALSAKYGKSTYSTSGAYNFALSNPNKPGHPLNYIGLRPPSNGSALSAWEDPSYIPRASWSPLSSLANMQGMIRTLFDNVKRIGAALLEFSILSVAFCFVILLVLLHKAQKASARLLLHASAAVVYMFGYVLLLAEFRYFWPVFISLSLLACLLLNEIKIKTYKKGMMTAVYAVSLLTVVVTPATQLYYQRNLQVPDYYRAEQFKSYIQKGDRVASNMFGSITYCFYLKATCYGVLSEANGEEMNQKQLDTFDIQKVIIYKDKESAAAPKYLSRYELKTTEGLVSVYQRKTEN